MHTSFKTTFHDLWAAAIGHNGSIHSTSSLQKSKSRFEMFWVAMKRVLHFANFELTVIEPAEKIPEYTTAQMNRKWK